MSRSFFLFISVSFPLPPHLIGSRQVYTISNIFLFFLRNDFSDYGCILEIREVQYFPDGRSLVDCIGGKRFKVLSRGQRDGYNTARVEFLSDLQPEGQELEGMEVLNFL